MKFITSILVVLVLVCFSISNANSVKADNIVLTMPPILASPNVVKDPTPSYGIVSSAGGRVWLDRNLGASQVATHKYDELAFGDLYQWGRFTDGHEKRTSDTTTMLSDTDVPGHPHFIVSATNEIIDWRTTPNNNLWQGVNGINNPCPSGFRLPTIDEWETERLSWISNDSDGAFASPLKLPAVDIRFQSGDFSPIVYWYHNWVEDHYYQYWSSTINGSNGEPFYLSPGRVGLWAASVASTTETSPRNRGSSVRCISNYIP